MAKKKTVVASHLEIQITGVTVNGRPVPDVDYRRTVHADGTVEERGGPLPAPYAALLPAPTQKGPR